jgi:hypothetical protein
VPRGLSALILFLLFVVLVLPDPVRAGTYTGDAIQSVVIFVRSIGNELDAVETGHAQVGVLPTGGIGTGDGTIAAGDGISVPTVSVTTPGFVAGDVLALASLRRSLQGESIGSFSHQPSAVTAARVAHLPASAPTSLRIPAINVATELVDLGLEADGSMEVPRSAQLAGWYRFGPTPGELGPAVITGHVDWKDQIGVLHDLDKLKEGDEVTVERNDGKTAVFRVVRVAEYPKEQFPTREVYGNLTYAALRIITCGGSFDPDASAYTHNVIVFATMI